jgi:two-component system, NtrC family, response regulator AtoC
MTMSKILVVDDEPKSVKLLRLRLEEMGHVLHGASTVNEAKSKLQSELFDLLITDVRLPDDSGLNLVPFAKSQSSTMPIIVVTAYGTIQDAVQAMQSGATDFVQKPFELEAMAMRVERALETAKLKAEYSYLVDQCLPSRKEVLLVGRSPEMNRVRELIYKVAATQSNVLFVGESGTGKELAAQMLHNFSTTQGGPLIKVNCPAIPSQLFESELFGHMKGAFTGALETRKGKFELAARGNILLDEISELPYELQAKLLRVIEERTFTRVGGSAEIQVDARIIAATNRDLGEMVKEGRFREDLYYRLNVFPVELPPLRFRKMDIPDIVAYLMPKLCNSCCLNAEGISDEALRALTEYHWPGNVRELRNILERAMVLSAGRTIHVEHLPLELQEGSRGDPAESDFNARLDDFKKSLLLDALRATDWSKKEAAKALGLSGRALSHYVSKYRLDDYRKEGGHDLRNS